MRSYSQGKKSLFSKHRIKAFCDNRVGIRCKTFCPVWVPFPGGHLALRLWSAPQGGVRTRARLPDSRSLYCCSESTAPWGRFPRLGYEPVTLVDTLSFQLQDRGANHTVLPGSLPTMFLVPQHREEATLFSSRATSSNHSRVCGPTEGTGLSKGTSSHPTLTPKPGPLEELAASRGGRRRFPWP